MTETTKNTTSRRAVTQGLAWSVPAVAAASAAPALAQTPELPTTDDYYGNGALLAKESYEATDNGVTDDNCPELGKTELRQLGLFTSSPQYPGVSGGITVNQMPGAEPTTATINGPLHAVAAYPVDMFKPDAVKRPGIENLFTDMGAGLTMGAWEGPQVTTTTMTDPAGITREYFVFDFTFTGSLTNPTNEYGSNEFWPNTQLNLKLRDNAWNSKFCTDGNTLFRGGLYTGAYDGSEGYWSQKVGFTTANGFVGEMATTTPDGWFNKMFEHPGL